MYIQFRKIAPLFSFSLILQACLSSLPSRIAGVRRVARASVWAHAQEKLHADVAVEAEAAADGQEITDAVRKKMGGRAKMVEKKAAKVFFPHCTLKNLWVFFPPKAQICNERYDLLAKYLCRLRTDNPTHKLVCSVRRSDPHLLAPPSFPPS